MNWSMTKRVAKKTELETSFTEVDSPIDFKNASELLEICSASESTRETFLPVFAVLRKQVISANQSSRVSQNRVILLSRSGHDFCLF